MSEFNIQKDGDGAHIGNAAQKIGFFGAAPVLQQTEASQPAVDTAGSGTAIKDDSTFTGGIGDTEYSVGDLVAALKSLGLIAE